jgi:hypothetical protein
LNCVNRLPDWSDEWADGRKIGAEGVFIMAPQFFGRELFPSGRLPGRRGALAGQARRFGKIVASLRRRHYRSDPSLAPSDAS